MSAANDKRAITVWDAPTRLFHWLVVALVAAAYATQALNWMDWHALAGDAVLVLVAFRLVWGFVGGETARFAGFLASPREALGHLKTMLKREPDLQVGHNPAGGWMVLMLLALLLGETLTGLYALDDVAEVGPLTPYVPAPVANWIDAAHATLWDILLAAVALHVLAVATYALAKGQNLLTPMITGRKRMPAGTPPPLMASWARAALAFCGGALIAAALIIMI
ncbi:MAG: cytochrome b/b6 domain-containing protein [Roseiarcus sp.]